MTVTNHLGIYLDWSVTVGPNDVPGSVHGLLGSDTGQANDFQLRDGTVLTPPLSDQQMLGLYANSWRVTSGASLLDDPQAPAFAQLVQAMARPPTTAPPAATVPDASTSGPMQNQNSSPASATSNRRTSIVRPTRVTERSSSSPP